MDIRHELNGMVFVWNAKKAASNPGKHDGITFEQAATAFFDPFSDSPRPNATMKHATRSSGLTRQVAYCTWCTSRLKMNASASFLPAGRPTRKGETMSIPERIKTRLAKDRPMTSITVRMPADVVESMKEIAPQRGFSGYQALLKSYIGEGLRRDEAQFTFGQTARLIEALKKRGVPDSVLDDAARELTA